MDSNKSNTEESTVINAVEYLEAKNKLDQEAYEAMPYKFDTCTYYEPNINRQQVFSCLDCDNIGLCYGCSISCGHSENNLIDINYKKNFTCDCGTDKDLKVKECNLYKNKNMKKEHNEDNRYGHNFNGEYCYCNTKDETDSDMVQCQLGNVCNEDWYHIKCLNLEKNNIEENDFEDLICSLCFQEYQDLFEKLFNEYKEYDWFIKIKVNKCDPAILLKNDYSKTLKTILNKEKLKNSKSDLSKFLGVLVYKDILDPYSYYEPPKDTFESLIKVDDVNYIKDEDVYSKQEMEILTKGIEGKNINLEKFYEFNNGLKTFLTDFAKRKDIIEKKDIDLFFSKLNNNNNSLKRNYDELDESASDPELEEE
ncbi:hypothetical protein HANVADRAFT_51476 [Hanseniaspora valbyensis NRRL Y-1626]|uniref:PHD-type domain-containing protein n=1 Tax=Hanseniaspora valbyensis NRRL Y-1626 TaxID=766949 RepID=A0A1B7TIN1_9ASCO|nr:hypothetical protein HANVADRAFT_51476 [Hanseniaspora valbyensis NRRL Y-1626]